MLKAGVSRYWFSSDALAAIVEQAINQHRGGKPVTFLGLMITSGLSPDQQALWGRKWAEAGEKDAVGNTLEIAKQLRRDAALREVQAAVDMIGEYAQNNPRDVLVWLPTVIQALRATLETGQRYDPRPSAIWATGYVPRVVAKFERMDTFNEMLGGGLWDGCLAIYGTPTSQGKSTLAYTMIAHAVANGFKTVLFSREASAAEAIARIVQAYGGFTRWEVEHQKGSSPERHRALSRSLRELDRYLCIYDRHSAALGDFRAIIHWEQPMLAIVDHLGLYGAESKSGLSIMGKRDPLGDLADILLDISREERLTIFATSQLSAMEQQRLYKDHDLQPPTFYGSSRILMAADLAYLAMHYWKVRGLEWIRCKKDRGEGRLFNWIWFLRYNGQTRSYEEYTEPDSHAIGN